ncbi:MAG: hypothetical protein FWD66_00890 [Paludibacter sp.]|nr:hypothetical protein [Paludibacter sp.]
MLKKTFSFSGTINQSNIQGNNHVDINGDISPSPDKLFNIIKNKQRNNWFYGKILGIIILSALILWGLAIVALKYFNLNLTEHGLEIILTFIGILATFIVVSNYMQVKDIDRKFENRITELNNIFTNKVTELNNKFNSAFEKATYDITLTADSVNYNLFYIYYEQKYYKEAIDHLVSLLIKIHEENVFDKILQEIYIRIEKQKPCFSKTDKYFSIKKLGELKIKTDSLQKIIELIENSEEK